MGSPIKLSDDIIQAARQHAAVSHRSVPKQIEYWSRIGKIAEENPDLPYDFIKDILLALQEKSEGSVTPFEFG